MRRLYSKISSIRYVGYLVRWLVSFVLLPRYIKALLEGVHRLRTETTALREDLDRVHRDLEHIKTLDDLPNDAYLAFEHHFRGSSEAITARLQPYLALLQEEPPSGDGDLPVLDLGCGRGELLKLLQDGGVSAVGVDSNVAMITACREQGLTAEEGDILEYLRQRPDDSVKAIFAIHVIEHLPLRILVEVLDQCRRVLAPGGLVILETPNPENLDVGSCNFYVDPTHRRPLHPVTVNFLVVQRGFPESRILRLTEHRDMPAYSEPSDSPVVEHVRTRLLAGPDFAVIGRKNLT